MKNTFERDLAIHAGLGIVCALQPRLVFVWVAYILLVEGTIKVFRSRNAYGQAHLAAAYMAAMEMIVRMSRIGLPHELTKYAVIFILLNGLLARWRFPGKAMPIVLYFILQLPSIFFLVDEEGLERARQLVSFNLTGPLCLAVAVIYFYRRPIDKVGLAAIFQQMLLPITSTTAWLFLRTPRVSEIYFGTTANFAASGYGPNQMASILGAGILLIGLAFLFRVPLFRWRSAAFLLVGLLIYRGLLTFSRGGMAIPILILGGLVGYFTISSRQFRTQSSRILMAGLLLVITGYSVYSYVNQRTGNALYNRYAGISYGQKVGLKKYTSGRLDIFNIDIKIFLDHPIFGIGPGAGTAMRYEYGYGERVAAHIEFSRLLAEHGLLGGVALGILLFFPLVEFIKRRGLEQRFLLVATVLFCFGFMAHSATRIALPMYLYGLGFCWVHFQRKDG